MAATRLIALHVNKGKSVARCLADRTDYSQNAEKTDGGKYISSYECDPKTADQEFLLSKREYHHITGRSQERDVIGYQIRQSFKPGEITPEEANQIGYELAMRFTKGKHAFIVATHIDRAHIHNHIIFNSTTLDCRHKFRNFRRSGLVVQRLSDLVCLEHGKSVITPKPYAERQKRTEYPKHPSNRNEIRAAINRALEKKPKDFEALIRFLQEDGYEYKNGKLPALKGKGGARFIRFRSLGDGYSVDDLKEAIAGKSRQVSGGSVRENRKTLDLPINIQQKLAEGKGGAYTRWAKVYNLKAAAKAVLFLEENDIHTIEQLREKTAAVTEQNHALLASVKASEKRMAEIMVLRTHIINYAKTREIYVAYRKAGYSKKFFEEHREELTIHKAAKEAFNQMEIKKLPKVKELNAEYAALMAEKKKTYAEYRKVHAQMQDYQIALQISEACVGDDMEKEECSRQEQEQKKNR
ncbi:MAG: relaxase/mobilization nuclease domain-containing protein [Lachnospiraceae bacterium]|nr:relaxase/mobilization nuclease domain-containing protein [Lachnospiraceae bacterium]